MTHPSHNNQKSLDLRAPSVIINKGAGKTEASSSEIETIFKRHNMRAPNIHVVDPADLGDSFKTVSNDGTDLLIILGGDGTCKSGAEVARRLDIPLVALPGGTMNMLPKALYGTDNYAEALNVALSSSQFRWQAAGNINGEYFYCGAHIGDPTIISDARESMREGDVIEAAKHVPEIIKSISEGDPFKVRVDGEIFDRRSNGLFLSCPFMTRSATRPDAFELASAPRLSMMELAGIGMMALASDWRNSADIRVIQAQTIDIESQGKIDVLLDGEATSFDCPVKISLEPKGVRVLAPEQMHA
jgi:diacylglycerol kinase family enzyme